VLEELNGVVEGIYLRGPITEIGIWFKRQGAVSETCTSLQTLVGVFTVYCTLNFVWQW